MIDGATLGGLDMVLFTLGFDCDQKWDELDSLEG